MIMIKNGLVINPATNTEEKLDVLIKEDSIYAIGSHLDNDTNIEESIKKEKERANYQEIDATGKVVAPGLVDVHVHFRDPGFTYKEDIHSGSLAAAKGGFTTVILMANTNPTVDNEETLAYIRNKASEEKIHVFTCASVTKGLKGQSIVDMKALFEKGAVGFTDDGIPIMNTDLLKEAMLLAKECNVPISLHEENPKLIKNNGINTDIAKREFDIEGSSKEAEISLVSRDVELAIETDAIVNFQHLSTKEAVECIRQGKVKGKNIHAEVTPHHFSLTQEALKEHGTLAKMNPPLRMEEDRQALIEGIKDGTIDIIATDHAPHSKEEKEKAFEQAPSGILGVETALPLAITHLYEKEKVSLSKIIECLSTNPANMYHLDCGTIEVGKKADLVIFDCKKEFTFNQSVSKSSNSPFLKKEFRGLVEFTIADGKIAYKNNES